MQWLDGQIMSINDNATFAKNILNTHTENFLNKA